MFHEQIVMYQPNSGRGVAVADTPAPLPHKGSDFMYSYENLPAEHWKKYLYAYRYLFIIYIVCYFMNAAHGGFQ